MKTTTAVSLLTLLASESLAANVVHLSISKGSAPAVARRHALQHRDTIEETLGNNITAGSYLAKVSVGTPGQEVELVIDTGSSDVFVVATEADQCNDPQLQETDGPCIGGTFEYKKSSTFDRIIPDGFSIQYQDKSGSSGDYFTDSLSIGGASITKFQMGLALNLTTGVGIMGIGYRAGESVNPIDQYPTLVEQLVSQKKINRKVYSLYLDDRESSTGSILFGGIDTKKFIGDIKVVPVEYDSESGVRQIDSFIVSMTSLTITDSSNSTVSMSGTTSPFTLPVILDSGTTITYVPSTMLQNIITTLNAVDDLLNTGIIFIDCNLRTSGTYLTFGFGGSSGPKVKVPVSEVIRDLRGSYTGLPFDDACSLGIKSSQGPYLLGDTFLRSAYVIYDLDNNEIGIAQTNFDATESNIVEIEASGTAIPTLTGVASGNTQGATGTSATSSGASTSKNGAAMTVPAFDVSNLAVICVSICFAALGGVGFLV